MGTATGKECSNEYPHVNDEYLLPVEIGVVKVDWVLAAFIIRRYYIYRIWVSSFYIVLNLLA